MAQAEGDEAEIAAALFDLANNTNETGVADERESSGRSNHVVYDEMPGDRRAETNELALPRKRPRRSSRAAAAVDVSDDSEEAFLVSDDEWDAEDEYLAKRTGLKIKRRRDAKRIVRKEVPATKIVPQRKVQDASKENAIDAAPSKMQGNAVPFPSSINHVQVARFIRWHRQRFLKSSQDIGSFEQLPPTRNRSLLLPNRSHGMHRPENISSLLAAMYGKESMSQNVDQRLNAFIGPLNGQPWHQGRNAGVLDELRDLLAQHFSQQRINQQQLYPSNLSCQHQRSSMNPQLSSATSLLHQAASHIQAARGTSVLQATGGNQDLANVVRSILLKSQNYSSDPAGPAQAASFLNSASMLGRLPLSANQSSDTSILPSLLPQHQQAQPAESKEYSRPSADVTISSNNNASKNNELLSQILMQLTAKQAQAAPGAINLPNKKVDAAAVNPQISKGEHQMEVSNGTGAAGGHEMDIQDGGSDESEERQIASEHERKSVAGTIVDPSSQEGKSLPGVNPSMRNGEDQDSTFAEKLKRNDEEICNANKTLSTNEIVNLSEEKVPSELHPSTGDESLDYKKENPTHSDDAILSAPKLDEQNGSAISANGIDIHAIDALLRKFGVNFPNVLKTPTNSRAPASSGLQNGENSMRS